MSDIVALKDIIKKLNFQKFDDDNSIRCEDVCGFGQSMSLHSRGQDGNCANCL